MSSRADQDLNSQQQHLSSTSYDLRITNLARFIYKKVTNYELRITNSESVISSTFDKLSINSVERSLRVGSPRWSFGKAGRDDKVPHLLDVGAGNGLFLKFFKEKGFEVAGYELEQKNVDNMKKDPMLKSIDIRQGDITNLRGSEKFDVVMASDVIEHIEDDELAIENLWSFVKPDGLLIITVPAHSYLYGKRDEKWGHFRRYDQKILLDHIKFGITNYELRMTTSKSKISNRPFRHPELDSGSKKMPKLVRHDNIYKIEFLTQWNIVGYFMYFLFEKILHKPINEKMRYSPSLFGRMSRSVIEGILRLEEMIGGLPLGLTLIVGVRKKINVKQ